MAKLYSNPLVGQLSGAVGDLVFVRTSNGEVYVRRRAERTVPSSNAEMANQQSFTSAVRYAKRVWAEQPDLRIKYTVMARLRDQQGFALAKADFLVGPEVQRLDLTAYTGKPGEVIWVEAVDNFEVKSVEVAIRDLTGAVLERGSAVSDGARWVYAALTQVAAGQTVVVEATAMDHPGNIGTLKADHACGIGTK